MADSLPAPALDALEERGHDCVVDAGLGKDDLPGRIAGFDVLVVRSTKVREQVFEDADRLALVIRAGAGTNTIDTAAAAARGVLVANVPGRNSAAVAELTMGLLLAIDRRIPDNVADLRAGKWNKKAYSKAAGLLGSTIGIIGLGSIGLGVAERAAAFGLTSRRWQKPRAPYVEARAAELGITMCDTLEELLESSDVVSLHVPASDETQHLVDEAFLGHLRPGAILLNTSRGDVVDEAALLEALDAGAVRAGLDVYADEPGSGTADWESRARPAPGGRRHPPHRRLHRAGPAGHRRRRRRDRRRLHRGPGAQLREPRAEPARLGDPDRAPPRPARACSPQVLDLLSRERLNVEHMENRVFRGGEAAMASIDVAGVALGRAARPGARGAPRARRLGDPVRGRRMTATGSVAAAARAAWCARERRRRPRSSRCSTRCPPPSAPRSRARAAGRRARSRPTATTSRPPASTSTGCAAATQEHVGLVADVLVEAFVDGRVRGHEEVQPERVAALVDLFSSDAVRSELVALLHRPGPAVGRAAGRDAVDHEPLLRLRRARGLGADASGGCPTRRARPWPRSSARAVHYVADGHHRVAASLEVWQRQGRPADAGVMCVIYPLDGLSLLAFHRRVAGPVDDRRTCSAC